MGQVMREITYELAKYVTDTDCSVIPKEVFEWAKVRVLDVLGCILVGGKASGTGAVLDYTGYVGGKDESTVLLRLKRVPAALAAMANAICARAFDFEPVGPYVHGVSYPAHISGTTIPVALAVAEAVEASGREMLGALALGEDIVARLVAGSDFTLEGGWDNTGTTNAFGACAIAGKLLGLNREQMQNAFGLVLNQLGGSLQSLYEAVDSFKLCQGLSAQAGILSAILARNGFTGPKEAVEGRHGYFKLYCQSYAAERVLRGLGESFHCDDVIKPYPCCRANHGAVDCVLDIVSRTGTIGIKDVKGIKVYVRPVVSCIFVNRAYGSGRVRQIDAAFNLRYCVAKAFLKGKLSVQHFIEPELSDPETSSLAGMVELIPEDFLDKEITTKVQVVLGREVLESSCKVPKGDRRYNPLNIQDVKDKFVNNLSLCIGETKATERLIGLIEELDMTDNVRVLMDEITGVLKDHLVPNHLWR